MQEVHLPEVRVIKQEAAAPLPAHLLLRTIAVQGLLPANQEVLTDQAVEAADQAAVAAGQVVVAEEDKLIINRYQLLSNKNLLIKKP